MTEDEVKAEEKVKMKEEDLVETMRLTQVTIQMAGATMALATAGHTTAIANPHHPGVTVDPEPLRDTQRGVSARHMTLGRSRKM